MAICPAGGYRQLIRIPERGETMSDVPEPDRSGIEALEQLADHLKQDEEELRAHLEPGPASLADPEEPITRD
jgi:hypothetical protein